MTKDLLTMDLRQLKYFLHAATTQNLTQASNKAWISQSAISRQIKLLEIELGVSLFDRQARGVRLTDAGAALMHHAEKLLRDVEDLKSLVGASNQEPIGTLRIGTPTSLRGPLVAPFFIEYHRRHPKVLLVHKHGTSKSMRDALADGELDLAVTSSQESIEPFSVEPLLSEALCLIGPAQAGLQIDKPVNSKRITEHPLILTSYPNSLRIIINSELAKLGQQITPVAEADTAYMKLDLVHQGLGYSVLPYSGVEEGLHNRYVSASPIRGLRIAWVIARSRERVQTIANQRAVELLHEITKTKIARREWRTARLP
jgi:LysR family transcriptional regulator, nitrogen assimilation regulatory protein